MNCSKCIFGTGYMLNVTECNIWISVYLYVCVYYVRTSFKLNI